MRRPCPFPCKLIETCRGPVSGYGDISRASVIFIGEAPGEEEDRQGLPFVGKAGKELDRYLREIGLNRENCYTTNLVKCRPPNNRDPEDGEKEACLRLLYEELPKIKPDAIVAPLGRHAAAYFIEDLDMELHHGIPQAWGSANTVVPIYHPAAGIHQTRFMSRIEDDFAALAKAIRREIKPEDWVDKVERNYWISDGIPYLLPGLIGIDTEDNRESIQVSYNIGRAAYIKVEHAPMVRRFFEDEKYHFIFHNAQHDLPRVLRMVGCLPKRWTCTMLMANLLGRYSRALKVLAYRLAGMRMRTYNQVVSPYQGQKSYEYLKEVADWTWPDPDPVRIVFNGVEKWKQPQPIHKKAQAAMKAYAKGWVDLWQRWHNIPFDERKHVEKQLGKMPEATLADVPLDEAVKYACADPDATLRIYPILEHEITKLDLQGALERDKQACLMVVGMENHGMVLDRDAMLELQKTYLKDMKDHEKTINAHSKGVPVNPGSHPQIRELLYKRLGLSAKKKSKKTGLLSTSDEALELLKDKHPVVEHIIDYRKLGVLESNFVQGSLDNAERNGGVVKPEISMIAVETGRFACYRPNLLAFPVEERNEHGKELRDCFVARPGCVFLAGDYSQIELRVMAHEAQEPAMMQAFILGHDIHQATASHVFKVPRDKVTSAQRYEIKAVNFGIPYGISPDGLHEMLKSKGYTRQQCVELIATWFNRFERVRAYLDRAKAEARRNGYVRDLMGRIRLIPEIKSAIHQVSSAGERYAGNTKIQMGAASIMKEAMGQLNGVFTSFDFTPSGGPILQIHDELIIEIPEKAVDWTAPMMRWTMENAIKLSVPLVADMKIGKKWGSMTKLEV